MSFLTDDLLLEWMNLYNFLDVITCTYNNSIIATKESPQNIYDFPTPMFVFVFNRGGIKSNGS